MLRIEKIADRTICIAGIGRMFYQEGLPIPIMVSRMQDVGIEVSILHVADECLKHGWSSKTAYTKLRQDLVDSGSDVNESELKEFCFSDYDRQREMIFNYLFGSREEALDWARHSIKLLA